ncbi:hypothetical protein GALL_423390 [mine drainage metagenome]|uniref:Uncharacterized protein n=1 Tax=mine drainage metagenome TaxID=410659 RepID=A0A1J5Q7Y6_9ZZZZ
MGRRSRASGLGLPRLDRYDALARLPRRLCQRRKRRGVVNTLDVQTQCRHPRVSQQCARKLGQTNLRRVAKAGDVGHRQSARLHGQVNHDV